MPNMVITEELKKFLLTKEFVSAGTSDLSGQPNAVPKYIIKRQSGTVLTTIPNRFCIQS